MTELEKILEDWFERSKTQPEKVVLEIQITQFALIYNIDQNLSLIRDILAKKIKGNDL